MKGFQFIIVSGLFLCEFVIAAQASRGCTAWLGENCLKPNQKYPVRKIGQSRAFSFKTNSHGWRRVVENTPGREKFMLLFGGSNAFGTGIGDGKTIADQLAKRFPSYELYNYSRPGWGPAHALTVLNHRKPKSEVTQSSGIAIFYYFSFHIGRIYANTGSFGWLRGRMPKFEIEGGKLVQRGTFVTDSPWLTATMSFLGKQFPRWNFPRATKSTRDLMCELLKETKRKISTDFPGTRFVVAIEDRYSFRDNIAEACLKPNHISHFRMGHRYPRHSNKFTQVDGHLNERGVRVSAKILGDVMLKRRWVEGGETVGHLAR